MAQIIPGRVTAQIDEPFVVFLIGMRINRVLAVRKWLPTAQAMGPMLQTLYRHPEKGFLGGELFLYWRGVALVQYWRSFDDLDRFARSREEPHLAPWKRYNQTAKDAGAAGIWHETYLVQLGQYESVYNNMPRFGLAAATAHVPAVGRRETARLRLGGENTPAVPTP